MDIFKTNVVPIISITDIAQRIPNNILKISRTIADLEDKEKIDVSCIAEAIQYKVDNKFYKKEV